MPHFTHACQNDAVARAVCDAIVKRGMAVVAITANHHGLPTVWYRIIDDEQMVQKVRGEIQAAENYALRGLAA